MHLIDGCQGIESKSMKVKEYGTAITLLYCTYMYKIRKKLISDKEGHITLMYGHKPIKLEFNVPSEAPKTSVGLQYSGWFLFPGTQRDVSLSVILPDSP